ncbi:class I SAM-dependent methyltransferase [Allorhizobium pseudoryzae]|uniref:class I SAM-dependent methyltransferase n=1 Tax=Allorhizobium pseudoryzae TaxID=379684 RepID=UPI003D040618
MSRLYDAKVDIDPSKVQKFFDDRARREANSINAVMLQPEGSVIAIERDRHEREMLLPRLDRPSKILDLGCGAGRLALHYGDGGHTYMGIDFSGELIAKGRELNAGQHDIHFAIAQVPHIDVAALPVQPPFDVLIITGLLIYLNDEAVIRTLQLMADLAAPEALVYIRESISDIATRLTLKDFFSQELNEYYNGVYRTRAELKADFEATFLKAGFRMTDEGYAFPEHLRNRAETTQYFYRFERKA